MKHFLVTSFASLLMISSSFGQLVGTTFPTIETETVKDEKVVLPEDTQGRVSVVAMAYSKKAEKDLGTWLSPLFNTFIQQKVNGGGGLF